ncbi:hypothetical protein N7462_000664 [Penicillium macrosclerotiorum]|uniref:uncharacterized protein n=1 Tax=Penicillium macrosclerotiorum TaxID=303699 RepID=UPI0025470A3E|nr:uncharacterized protein N7462_000664 [Penicillium macrosclerotiorum]KAJ5698659.1 hypothetical protein N7462_000664 [Penicillium macrosclerotiorum]
MPDDSENMRGTRDTQRRPSHDTDSPASASTEPTSPTLATRIQRSAAALARTALPSSGPDTTHTLSSATSKATPSSSSSAHPLVSQDIGSASRTPATTLAHPPRPTFRTTPKPKIPHPNLLPPASQKGKQPASADYSSAWARATQDDGAAVVALLNSPDFNADFNAASEPDMSDEPAPLTAEEIAALEAFRRGVGAAGADAAPGARLTSASLVPDIDAFLAQDSAGPGETVAALRDRVLGKLAGAEEWVGVHERYHDEVWGFLRPALEAAKAEMEEKRDGEGEGESEGEGPAVRRLRMILEHMRA